MTCRSTIKKMEATLGLVPVDRRRVKMEGLSIGSARFTYDFEKYSTTLAVAVSQVSQIIVPVSVIYHYLPRVILTPTVIGVDSQVRIRPMCTTATRSETAGTS